jgi:hypothetical protein
MLAVDAAGCGAQETESSRRQTVLQPYSGRFLPQADAQ